MKKKYKTKEIEGLTVNQSSNSKDVVAGWMNAVSAQIDACPDNLGSFADIVSIEHFETYRCLAENTHIKFTVQQKEQPKNALIGDDSSTRIEDYDYAELTKTKVSEK